ncbi:PREDICTED: 60S ribosomal protein L29-like [Myotis brandtii]|uniref:60S ribosomal protein L29-like n=1 Tax=Myotis brandtii TaxID=109478 RepID=UPI000704336F|nr:PREDICTED: 60S ribosomal protein L29-like [Myotis brandtii]
MCFAKNHNKKNLEKMQAKNAKAMSAYAKAIKTLRKPKEFKPKTPKDGYHKLSQLAYITHPKLGKHAHAHIAKGLRLCWPKSKAKIQTRPQAAATAQAQALAPKVAHAPMKAAQWRPLSANVRAKGLVGPLGCCYFYKQI